MEKLSFDVGRARKDEMNANRVGMLGDFIKNQVARSCKRDSEVFLPFPSRQQTLVKASEVGKNLNTESYRSEAKRLNDFPIFFFPSVYGLGMINSSLNRIRNEDILHLQREKNVATVDFSAGLSNNHILTRQFEFKSAEPVSITRHGWLYGEGS